VYVLIFGSSDNRAPLPASKMADGGANEGRIEGEMEMVVQTQLSSESMMSDEENEDNTTLVSATTVNQTMGHKVMNYVLNRTRAVKKKLKWIGDGDIDIELKDSDKCGIIHFNNTEDFERVRDNFAARYWTGTPLRTSCSQSAEWTEHSETTGLVVQDVIVLKDERAKLATVTIYRTGNMVMVQGVHVVQWLSYEFPLILQGSCKRVVFNFHRQDNPSFYRHRHDYGVEATSDVEIYASNNHSSLSDVSAGEEDADLAIDMGSGTTPPRASHSANSPVTVASSKFDNKTKTKVRVISSRIRKTSTPNPKGQSATTGLLAIQFAVRTLESTVKGMQVSMLDAHGGCKSHIDDSKQQSVNTMRALVSSLSGRLDTMEQERSALLKRMQVIETTNFKLRGKIVSLEQKIRNVNVSTDSVANISQQLCDLSASVSHIHDRHDTEAGEITPSGSSAGPTDTPDEAGAAASKQMLNGVHVSDSESDSEDDTFSEPFYTVKVNNTYDVIRTSSVGGGTATKSAYTHESTKTTKEFSLNLPNECAHVILGSSMTKDLRPRRMDSAGKTHVRSFGGSKIGELKRAIVKSSPLPKCQILTLLVGSNDICAKRASSTIDLSLQYSDLLTAVQVTFPNALVRVCSVLPRNGKLGTTYNGLINDFNKELESLCDMSHTCFLDIQAYFKHQNGAVKLYLFIDPTHLNEKGSAMLANLMRVGANNRTHESGANNRHHDSARQLAKSRGTNHSDAANTSSKSKTTGPTQIVVHVPVAQSVPSESQVSDNPSTRVPPPQPRHPVMSAQPQVPFPMQTGFPPVFGNPIHSAPYGLPAVWQPGHGAHGSVLGQMNTQQWQPPNYMSYYPYMPQSYMPRSPPVSLHGGPMHVTVPQ
jgi:hypothetical protein